MEREVNTRAPFSDYVDRPGLVCHIIRIFYFRRKEALSYVLSP